MGTYGDSDLFKIAVNEDGSFGAIEHLSNKINTEGRETFPFVTEKNTLVFASNGHPGLGGLDLFSIDLSDPLAEVISLGTTVNSAFDDFGMVINTALTKGYYTSNKPGGAGDDDLYSFNVVEIQKPKTQTPKVALAAPMAPPAAVTEVPPETPPTDPEQSLPAENASPSTAAADIPKAEAPAAPATTETTETTKTSETPAAQATFNIPGSVRLTYEMTGLSGGFTYHATGVMTWLQDGSRYDANMVVSAFLIGSRSLSSVGDITADGLAPKRFADKFRNELAAHFQADKGKITFSANTPDAPWKRGAQDRLSVFFQLASLLAGQPDSFPLGTKIPIYTAGQKDADTWTFSVTGREELNLPQGSVTAIKLTRDPRQAFDQRVEAWFAPSLAYWPVRIKVTQQSGDYIDQQLSSSGPP